MFSLVRCGPKILFLESSDIQGVRNYMTDRFSAQVYAFSSAFEKAGEDSTILFVTDAMQETIDEKDAVDILIVSEEPDAILSELINDRQMELVNKIRIAPRMIIVRAIGDLEKVIQAIYKDYSGSFCTLTIKSEADKESGTLVAVTDKPLNCSMQLKDLYDKCLYVDQGFYPLFKSLRLHALKYLNKGIDNKDWYEIEIRIFDRYSAYNLQHQRLTDILDFLDLGIILGESWTKDYPRPMMALDVYRVHFFTFHNPKYIKRVMVGLEYLEDGTRIVDFDVIYRRNKMNWAAALQKGEPRVRHLIGKQAREEIFSNLSSQEAEIIRKQEEEILKTRY